MGRHYNKRFSKPDLPMQIADRSSLLDARWARIKERDFVASLFDLLLVCLRLLSNERFAWVRDARGGVKLMEIEIETDISFRLAHTNGDQEDCCDPGAD